MLDTYEKFKIPDEAGLTTFKKNHEVPIEWRIKMRMAKLGKRLSKEHKNKIRESCKKNGVGKWMFGRRLSDKVKNKIGRAGNKHWNWRDGNRPYPREFNEKLKNEIRQRDNFLCQFCHFPGKDVHHIDRNKTNLTKINLITTCRSHNIKANYRPEMQRYFNFVVCLEKKYAY